MRNYFIKLLTTMAGLGLLSGAALATTYPGGEIVRNGATGAYFLIYHAPGTNYGSQSKRYIGSSDVLNFYLRQRSIKHVPTVTPADLASTPDFNHGLTLPCGEWARDRASGRMYVMQPGDLNGDQSTPPFAYSSNFVQFVQGVPPNNPYLSEIVRTVSPTAINEPAGASFDNRYHDIPQCTIVKQAGSQDYYRVVGVTAFDPGAPNNERHSFAKSKIDTPELLSQWLHYNTFAMTADLTSLPSVTAAGMIPGLLVRSTTDPTVYFTDDEGAKVPIPTLATFYGLGFNTADVQFVGQSALDHTPTATHPL